MSRIPTIPDFIATVESHDAALRTLKLAMELLGGLRQGEARGVPLMFVQGHDPRRQASAVIQVGDLWIDTSTNKMYFWSEQGVWAQVIGT